MPHAHKAKPPRPWQRFGLVGLCALALASPVWAGPGAHGPNGEHLSGPPQGVTSPGAVWPRIEAATERYELVGRFMGGELSMWIDHFGSNEPVLGAWVEVELGGAKARAAFHADQGDYAVDDPEFLKRLAEPGEHPLRITLRPSPGAAGLQADVLAGVLRRSVPSSVLDGHKHSHGPSWPWALGGGLLALAVGLGLWQGRRGRWARVQAESAGQP